MATVQPVIPQIQTITLQPGQSAYIPVDAIILSIDGGTITSDCMDITPKPLKCYRMVYTMSNDIDSANEAWDANDPTNRIKGVYVNGVEYACDYDINFGLNSAVSLLVAKGGGAIIDALASTTTGGVGSERATSVVTFKAPESIGSQVYFKMWIVTAGSVVPGIIRVYSEEADCVDIT